MKSILEPSANRKICFLGIPVTSLVKSTLIYLVFFFVGAYYLFIPGLMFNLIILYYGYSKNSKFLEELQYFLLFTKFKKEVFYK